MSAPARLSAQSKARLLLIAELSPIVIVLFVLFGGALVLAVLQSFGFAPWFGINTFPDFSYFGALCRGRCAGKDSRRQSTGGG